MGVLLIPFIKWTRSDKLIDTEPLHDKKYEDMNMFVYAFNYVKFGFGCIFQ